MLSRTITLFAIVGLSVAVHGPAASAQSSASAGVSAADRADIQALLARYQQALSTCHSKEYSELFTPDGTFTSDDFRGAKHHELYGKSATLVGRDKLVQLVETEEFCMNPEQRAARAARARNGGAAPNLDLQPAADGVKGVVPLGNGGRYEDVYVKTADGWKFKSRTVVMPPAKEKRD